MCGISGLYYFDRDRPVAEALIDGMRHVARHRGPDDTGIYLSGSVGLGFNRLSIIDLAGGHQPLSNEDGTVWIVFNGEIYNFQTLHKELEARGHQFRTRSDTETIVHAWEEYGESCVEKLRGMFAFAIWDDRRQVLFAARDRLGIKPFYYYTDRRRFAFASEIKSLLEIPEIPREIETQALSEFLRRRYVIAPNTMLRGMSKLEPGHSILVNSEGVRSRKYWDVPLVEPREIGESEAIEQTGALLEECVRMHLVSDVPVGAFLSGGLDSSCVVGLMDKMGVSDIKTFSIGYDGPESELDYARVVANHFRTDHHELRLTAPEFRDVLPKIVWHMDEPVGDTASIPLFYLSQFARQTVKVALSGEGSDELFGGYPIYSRMLNFSRLNRVPGIDLFGRAVGALAGDTKIRKYAEMLGKPIEWRYGGVGGLFSHKQAARLLEDQGGSFDGVANAYAACTGFPDLARMSYVDIKTWLADDLLVKADRMTMGNSLELRVPFLDHVLLEHAAHLPSHLKVRGKTTKYLLKRWAERLLPREIVYRAKKGFPVPTSSWFRGDLAGFAQDTLLAKDGPARKYFSAAEIQQVFNMHARENRSEQIYSLLVFDSWHRQFVQPHAPILSSHSSGSGR
jgi:asparagine synthase (glutamine-hydrolysing)